MESKGLNEPLQLVVGLGNSGARYAATRHNVGFWFVDELARRSGAPFRLRTKFFAELAEVIIAGQRVYLLKPMTQMNLSGQSTASVAHFYRIKPTQILVIHDEIDLPIGEVRLKRGGGHGGHNGVRDIISRLGTGDFVRLRLGISHPGAKEEVTGHVLGQASAKEREELACANERILGDIESLLRGEIEQTMNRLHRKAGKRRSQTPDIEG